MPQYKNIFEKTINIHGSSLDPGETINTNETPEIKKAIFHKYLEKVS